MNAIGKELARIAIDGLIAVMVPVLMLAALAAEGYYLFWPTLGFCVEHRGALITGCDTLTMLTGMTIVAVTTVAGIYTGGKWLQDFAHRHLHFLDWA